MEDAHIAIGSLAPGRQDQWATTGLFGVFDGHGGAQTANFCAAQLPHALFTGNPLRAPYEALNDSFLCLDEMLGEVGKKIPTTDRGHPNHQGCTAIACLLRKDSIIVANAGDSRAVLSRNGVACELSKDHKPELSCESARIIKAGGYVAEKSYGPHTIHRVNGDLAVSRAVGDLRFKQNANLSPAEQIVSCAPDLRTCCRQPEDEFLVLACDGVWDVMTSQEVVNCIRGDLPGIRRGDMQPADVVCKILDKCISPDLNQTFGKGGDNMTMILVVFEDAKTAAQPQQPAAMMKPAEFAPSTQVVQGYTPSPNVGMNAQLPQPVMRNQASSPNLAINLQFPKTVMHKQASLPNLLLNIQSQETMAMQQQPPSPPIRPSAQLAATLLQKQVPSSTVGPSVQFPTTVMQKQGSSPNLMLNTPEATMQNKSDESDVTLQTPPPSKNRKPARGSSTEVKPLNKLQKGFAQVQTALNMMGKGSSKLH
jgi:serine/threonine protein phosphatase PrpC